MSGRISGLKNKIAALRITVIALEMTPDNKRITSLDNQILGLKQDVQCKQVSIDSLEYLLDLSNKRAGEAIGKMLKADAHIKSLEDKKIKNRLKKFLVG